MFIVCLALIKYKGSQVQTELGVGTLGGLITLVCSSMLSLSLPVCQVIVELVLSISRDERDSP